MGNKKQKANQKINRSSDHSLGFRDNPLLLLLEELKIKFRLVSSSTSGVQLVFSILARPGSKQARIEIMDDGTLKVWVHARPVEGEANRDICEILAKNLGLSTSAVEIIRGGHGKKKEISVRYSFSNSKDIQYYLQKIKESILRM